MRSFGMVAGILALSLGGAGIAGAGEGAGPFARAHAGAGVGDITRKLRVTRWYGVPEYRCGQYTTVCRYVRPVHRSTSWSVSYRAPVVLPAFANPPVRLGLYRVEPPVPVGVGSDVPSYLPGRQAPTRVTRSGGFVRVEAPGKATRWVRAKDLARDK